MDGLTKRYQIIEAMGYDNANLYHDGDLTFINMRKVALSLPIGVYRFSAVATSTDTDASICCVRFMSADDQDATTETETQSVISRSTAGESHSLVLHCVKVVSHLYLYASSKWVSGQGDTVTYKKIRIERIG